MVSILFFIATFLSLVHLLLESAILPSERLKLRYSLFELRDELRWKAINEPGSISAEEYKVLSDKINGTISNMGYIVPSTLFKVHTAYDSDENFKKVVDTRKSLIENSQSDFVKSIDAKAGALTLVALGINSGGWLIVILPFFLLYKIVVRITSYALNVKNWFLSKVKIDELALAPKNIMKSIIPDYSAAQLDY
tara:strand:- start:705 stop:1286 length:582 start_codon:yes stop_codon:yes gene_type:complete